MRGARNGSAERLFSHWSQRRNMAPSALMRSNVVTPLGGGSMDPDNGAASACVVRETALFGIVATCLKARLPMVLKT